jgi:hypothetical protein
MKRTIEVFQVSFYRDQSSDNDRQTAPTRVKDAPKSPTRLGTYLLHWQSNLEALRISDSLKRVDLKPYKIKSDLSLS